MLKTIQRGLVGGLLTVALSSTHALSYNKLWAVTSIFGRFQANAPWLYYIEPQLRLIDNRYKFEEALLLAGLGYQINPQLAVYIGPTAVLSKNLQGVYRHEKRLWQQLVWNLPTTYWRANYRLRFEARERTDVASQHAYRVRQRIWLRIPFSGNNNIAWSLFDELLTNLNHPQWVSPHFIAQNRAFIGINQRLSAAVMVDYGYMHQAIYAQQQQNNNVALIAVTINL